jgi:hypothetical protein
MPQPYLALITPLTGGGHPDQGLPGGGNFPSHPWVPPSPGAPVYPDQGLPGSQPQPSHPIVIPGAPEDGPGSPQHPIYITGIPSHPIYIPGFPAHPLPPAPDQGLPGIPPGIPTHPWVPPSGEELPPPPEDIANNYVAAVWNPTKQEWKVTVAGPTTPTPK